MKDEKIAGEWQIFTLIEFLRISKQNKYVFTSTSHTRLVKYNFALNNKFTK